MTVADDILDQVHREAGLTATEIAVRVYGRRSYQQKVGQNCRRLVEAGRLNAMAKRPGRSIFTHHPPSKRMRPAVKWEAEEDWAIGDRVRARR